MRQQTMLLPKMAVNNIRKNSSTYFPYIGVSIFAVFTYFVFDLILKSDVMYTLPKAGYALILVEIGFALLGFILVPFLYYTNSFLIKRRKKELGLYSILGMEKKHIGIMIAWESLMIYGIVILTAVLTGLLFSKVIFLVLLNLARLPVDVSYTISPQAIVDAAVFYAFVTALNLFVNLFQVGKANPVELMSGSKKGEKEPKHILLWSVVGILFLGLGYYMAVTAKIDSMIFIDFFGAVICVVVGTYCLFTSGSIALLSGIRRNRKIYYRADNFITVSGMLYRMKKNAAGLSNICIFATMTIVTVVCTVAVYLGTDSITEFLYPTECKVYFAGENAANEENVEAEIYESAMQNDVELTEYQRYSYCEIAVTQEDNEMRRRMENDPYEMKFLVKLMTLEEYNRLEGMQETLEQGEVLLYCTGQDFGYDTIRLDGQEHRVKSELSDCRVGRKEKNNGNFSPYYVIVLPNSEKLQETAAFYGVSVSESMSTQYEFTPIGAQEALNGFYERLNQNISGADGFAGLFDYRENIELVQSMYGGLLFIGIFFGLIFLICLLAIMYYKQITEGFEDQRNFEIMQKIGMSDEEISLTIKKQILMVFALPILGAVCHTAVAMKMIIVLFSCLNFYETGLIITCAVGITLSFAVFYGLCYQRTARTYYRIVKKMG